MTYQDVLRIADWLSLPLPEWVLVLSHYSTEKRLEHLLPILNHHPRAPFTHRELALIVCASREKVTRAIGELRARGLEVPCLRGRGRARTRAPLVVHGRLALP